MKTEFQFTYGNLEKHYKKALEIGYKIMSCSDFMMLKGDLPPLTLVNRVDVDQSLQKAERLKEIYDRLNIGATFFVRLHAREYNPFSFENYRILKSIRDSGYEIGYHSEVIDQATIWNEDPDECLKRDLDVLRTMLGVRIQGIASHGGSTGLNNLDFFKDQKATNFGASYEAYENSSTFNLFTKSMYISDSEWTRWKCYDKGVLVKGNNQTPSEHFVRRHPLIYMLVHPDTYYERHFYE